MPTMEADATSAAATPEENAALRKRLKSISGCGLRRWRRTKRMSAMAPITAAARPASSDGSRLLVSLTA
ncbi:hypothetical protein D9M72_490670 [compost metagenome]